MAFNTKQHHIGTEAKKIAQGPNSGNRTVALKNCGADGVFVGPVSTVSIGDGYLLSTEECRLTLSPGEELWAISASESGSTVYVMVY